MPKLFVVLVLLVPVIAHAESALRDPMRPYSPPTRVAEQKTSFVLNAIFVSSRRKLAIVNGERVRVGQTIDGAVVRDIQADHMTLSHGGRSFTLSLGDRFGSKTEPERDDE